MLLKITLGEVITANREVYDKLKISENALNRNLRENTDNSTN